MGVMTQFLVEKPRCLRVVEIDRESVEYLEKTLFKGESRTESSNQRKDREETDVSEKDAQADGEPCAAPCEGDAAQKCDSHIIFGDFLRMDLQTLFAGGPFVLTGNYPYDISTQIFFKMLDNRDLIPCCTGMIQREVALRIASQPGNKQYGILSVLIQAWYDVEYLFTVEPSVFNPPPKVQSAVIRMTRNQVEHLGCDEQLFRRVVKTTFNQRRKMLRVSLRQLLPHEQTTAPSAILSSPFATLRPEQLSIEQFVELTNLVEKELLAGTAST